MKSVLTKLILVTLMYFMSGSAVADEWMRTRMFFGLSVPDGTGVSLQQWEQFRNEVIAPTFKAGFNVVDSIGFWHGGMERSKILTVFYQKEHSESFQAQLKKIAKKYATTFKQDSVLMVTTPVNVEFIKGVAPE